jgi:hypothetical protein
MPELETMEIKAQWKRWKLQETKGGFRQEAETMNDEL